MPRLVSTPPPLPPVVIEFTAEEFGQLVVMADYATDQTQFQMDNSPFTALWDALNVIAHQRGIVVETP